MEQLRSEILEAHNARSDLLKWKLVLVAGLGTIGLGLTQEIAHPIVLIGIPLVCAYVDLLTRHLTLRIHVIAGFLRTGDGSGPDDGFFRRYEAFVERTARRSRSRTGRSTSPRSCCRSASRATAS